MQLRKLLLPGLLSVTLLSGCSLFNSEEDVVKMSPLPTVETSLRRPRPGAPLLAMVSAISILTCIRLLPTA
jgi:hypothetical protein